MSTAVASRKLLAVPITWLFLKNSRSRYGRTSISFQCEVRKEKRFVRTTVSKSASKSVRLLRYSSSAKASNSRAASATASSQSPVPQHGRARRIEIAIRPLSQETAARSVAVESNGIHFEPFQWSISPEWATRVVDES